MIAVEGAYLGVFLNIAKLLERDVTLQLGITGAKAVEEAKDLISKMLCYDPKNRLTMSDVCAKIQNILG